MDLRHPLALLVPLVPLALLAVPAAGADTVELTFEARESDCPDDRSYCYVVQGDLGEVAPGDTVRATFRNAGQVEHELAVAALQDANVGGDTFESAAFFEIEPIGTGDEAFGNFTVPADAEGLYFWCDISGHEQLGMYTELEFEGEDDNGAPAGLWPVLAAVGVAVWLARR